MASANTRASEARVMGRPPRPAITACTASALPANEVRTFDETMPPRPTARLFSITTTRLARASALRTAASGQGRKQVTPSTPIFAPPRRISSTVSLIVPSTEPSATTTVSASSVR